MIHSVELGTKYQRPTRQEYRQNSAGKSHEGEPHHRRREPVEKVLQQLVGDVVGRESLVQEEEIKTFLLNSSSHYKILMSQTYFLSGKATPHIIVIRNKKYL